MSRLANWPDGCELLPRAAVHETTLLLIIEKRQHFLANCFSYLFHIKRRGFEMTEVMRSPPLSRKCLFATGAASLLQLVQAKMLVMEQKPAQRKPAAFSVAGQVLFF